MTLRGVGFCTIYGTRIMALKARTKAPSVRIQAAPALAMALFEQKGLTDLIDSRFELDPRIKLTPGNAVKAMVGQMLSSERRRALFGLNDFYVQTPTERLFGKGVDLKALGATAFSRNLDRLFEKNLGELTYECYSRLAGEYGLKSNMFNVDMTNFGVTSLSSYPDLIGAAVPERCGHAKDGMGIDRVYLHRPFRENAMMFVISLATMLSDVVTHVLKTSGIDMTMQGISGTMSRLDIVQDADGEYLDGSEEHIDLFMRMLETLRIDPDHLLG